MSDQTTDAPKEGQADVKPWYDGADADTVGFVQNKKWDSPLKVVNDYRNLEKFHGVPADQILKLPKSSEDKEGWNAIFTRLGRPESPDKYGTDGIKVAQGTEINQEILTQFDSLFHEVGLTKAQRDAIASKYMGFEAETVKSYAEKTAQERALQETALKKEWGAKYEERLTLARNAIKAFAPQGSDPAEISAALEETLGVGITAKMFANLADRLAEDKFHDDGDRSQSFGYTKEQAINDKNSLMSELRASPERLANYNKGIGPDYDKMNRLNKLIAQG